MNRDGMYNAICGAPRLYLFVSCTFGILVIMDFVIPLVSSAFFSPPLLSSLLFYFSSLGRGLGHGW
jgi:hypothetical protein